MLLDQFSRGLHLSPDILDVLIESHILTQLEFHNYTRIPTKTRTCSLQRGGDKKSFSLLFPYFSSHIEKRKSKTMLFCLFVCVLRTGALQLKLLSLSFLFFLTFHIKVGIGWPVGSGLKEEKKEKEKRKRKLKKEAIFTHKYVAEF